MVKTFKKMPNGNYISNERSFGDTYIQSKKTGRMKGRRSVRGVGDRTGVRRVTKSFAIVKRSRGRRGYSRKIIPRGRIMGKTKKLRRL